MVVRSKLVVLSHDREGERERGYMSMTHVSTACSMTGTGTLVPLSVEGLGAVASGRWAITSGSWFPGGQQGQREDLWWIE